MFRMFHIITHFTSLVSRGKFHVLHFTCLSHGISHVFHMVFHMLQLSSDSFTVSYMPAAHQMIHIHRKDCWHFYYAFLLVNLKLASLLYIDHTFWLVNCDSHKIWSLIVELNHSDFSFFFPASWQRTEISRFVFFFRQEVKIIKLILFCPFFHRLIACCMRRRQNLDQIIGLDHRIGSDLIIGPDRIGSLTSWNGSQMNAPIIFKNFNKLLWKSYMLLRILKVWYRKAQLEDKK